jgi:hypothetical protein
MANARNGKKANSGRDAGGFVALPWSVLDCPAYAALSANAKALLLEVARQHCRDNNGRLLLSRAYMTTRGWKSVDMIAKGKQELLAAGFIHETVKGQRPNKASWYAVTWQSLDKIQGFDQGSALLFQRSAYLKKAPVKNAPLIPSHGTERPAIAPPHGTETPLSVPPHGAMEGVFQVSSVPPHGHLLEKPSIAVAEPASNSTVDTIAQPSKQTPAIDSLDVLWAAVGCRSNWTTPTKPERVRRARDAQQRAIDRHRSKPGNKSAGPAELSFPSAGAARHSDDFLTREHDEHAHDLSAWID